MKRQATFGMTDTKLLARLERKRLPQNKKKRKEKAQKEKETLAMVPVPVADDYDRDQSVYEEIDENFCEPPAKQSKNSDHILLYVPQNIASISQVVMAADQNKISRNALNDIAASIIRESQGRLEDFVLSKTSTLKDAKNFVMRNLIL